MIKPWGNGFFMEPAERSHINRQWGSEILALGDEGKGEKGSS